MVELQETLISSAYTLPPLVPWGERIHEKHT
jgi:hypothetical protein